MAPATTLPDEDQRQRALHALAVLDTGPEPLFDALVAAAALVCGMPVSLLSLLDSERQWFKANVGLPGVTETPRALSFCTQAMLGEDAHGNDVVEIPDARIDPRFADNPFVTGDPRVRFYAGAPLRLRDGATVGSLCVIGHEVATLTTSQRVILRHLADCAVHALEARASAIDHLKIEASYHAMVEAAPLGLYVTDADGACTYTNPRWRVIFGLSAEEGLGDGWTRTVHPDDQTGVFAAWKDAAARRASLEREFRIRHADGTELHVRSVSEPVIDAAGAVTGYVGTIEDVTERFRAQRVLQEERRRLAWIIEGTGAGTWETNVQTGETRYNARWAEILGRTLADLGATTMDTWASLVHPDDLERAQGLLAEHFRGERDSYDCELRLRHGDGHWVWILDRGCVLTRSADGRPEWMFGTHVDITARKLQEQAIRRNALLLDQAGALTDVGGWELDIAAETLILSDQTCRIHGILPGSTLTLREALQFYAPASRPVLKAAIQQSMTDGSSWDLELACMRPNGAQVWVHAVGHAEFDGGRPVRLLGAIQDVTTRVREREARELIHERMALATDSAGIGVWDYDLLTGRLTGDASMHRLYGVPADQSDGNYALWAGFIVPEDREGTDAAVSAAIDSSDELDIEFRIVRADGELRHLRGAGRVTRDADGRAVRVSGVNWDVTSIRRLSAELAAQHELLSVTLQSIGDAVITTDAMGRVTWLNPAAEKMTGWPRDEAHGRALAHVFHTIHQDTRLRADSPVAICLQTGQMVVGARHALLVSRGGAELGIEDSASPIRNAQGELLGVVLVFRDVTEQRRMSREMSHRASHDALTGLVNRAEFDLRLRRALRQAHEEHTEHALLYIDLDEFKLVNDAGGHSVGDQLLQQVAKLLSGTVRSRDTLARLGGDEFAVLLENCTSVQAQRVAQQICDRMDTFRFSHDERRFRIGASIGLVPIDQRWDSAVAVLQAQRVAQQICDRMDTFRFSHDERRFRIGASIGLVPVDARWDSAVAVLQAADSACYAAKDGGRNRVHAWLDSDASVRERQSQMQWATRLEQAIDEGRFVLHGQRICALDDGCTGLHVEVLLRMLDDDGSLIAPGAFLPAAERFHLAARLDRWVMVRAIETLSALPDPGLVQTMCINLSGQSIGDRSFHRHAIDLLTAASPDICRRVCLEITETAAVMNIADASLFIDQVRALGVRIALDDFGAGASSFGYLKTLNVDILKIDGQFVRNMLGDPLDAAAVRCFVDVARVLGVQTIAEFVDHPDVLARLREIGVDFAQGFLLHRPEPLHTVLGTIAAESAPDAAAAALATRTSVDAASAASEAASSPR